MKDETVQATVLRRETRLEGLGWWPVSPVTELAPGDVHRSASR